MTRRPLGIVLTSWVAIAFGRFATLVSVPSAYVMTRTLPWLARAEPGFAARMVGSALYVLSLGILMFVAGIALLRLRRWAAVVIETFAGFYLGGVLLTVILVLVEGHVTVSTPFGYKESSTLLEALLSVAGIGLLLGLPWLAVIVTLHRSTNRALLR